MGIRNGSSAPDRSAVSRRSLFSRTADGICGAALTYLLGRDLFGGSGLLAAGSPAAPPAGAGGYGLTPRPPHFAPRAKAVIQLFMHGGPSQMDLFDPKPALDKHHGQPYFDKVSEFLTTPEKAGGLMRSPFKFARHGQSGVWLSDVLPHLATVADELCVVRSMFTTHPNHEPAIYKIQGGQIFPGRPALGAWVSYGLGSACQNLPAYVVLEDPAGLPTNGTQNWEAGFLPPVYQGTRFRSAGAPVLNLRPEVEEPAAVTRIGRDLVERLDRIHRQSRHRDHPQLDARIASYELAARMQLSAGEALDLGKETPETLAMYGVGGEHTDGYARRCLMARRLVERGVRFVQICLGSGAWDSHSNLESEHRAMCLRTDQPVAALLRDLKGRGLLDETLVIWGGEFGRGPISENGNGRDHGMRGFTSWLAGGGARPGCTYGSTDDFGFVAVENPVSVADWHATILHLLGLHHEELFFERSGLKERLTGVEEPRVIREILA